MLDNLSFIPEHKQRARTPQGGGRSNWTFLHGLHGTPHVSNHVKSTYSLEYNLAMVMLFSMILKIYQVKLTA